jgi:hypothetical protein
VLLVLRRQRRRIIPRRCPWHPRGPGRRSHAGERAEGVRAAAARRVRDRHSGERPRRPGTRRGRRGGRWRRRSARRGAAGGGRRGGVYLGRAGIAVAAGCRPRRVPAATSWAWLRRRPCPRLRLARRAMCAMRFRQFSRVQPISNHFNDIYFGLVGLLH